MLGFLKKIFGSAQDRTVKKYFKIVDQVNEWDEKYKSLSDEELKAKTVEFKERLQRGETLEQLLPEAFGVVKNVCRRLVGTEVHVSGYNQQWDMIPYDVQIVGAIALFKGSVAEMQTGEGKTLTATIALYLHALTGKPVHLVTVNDYLVERDCQWVGTILRWLGLTTGALNSEISPYERKKIYDCDVVYGTSSEFGFDYLRDNSMATRKEEQVQRGFYYAIIDEADSILIDDARTPLIISGPTSESRQLYDELKEGVAELVLRQRDFCNRLASEARKALESLPKEGKKSKEQEEKEREALHKLWLVGKGTPQNKTLKKIKEDPDFRAGIDKWDLYYYADQNKEDKLKALAELFILIDEKSNEFEITDKGIHAWEECTGGGGKSDDFVMLDISHEYLLIDQDPKLDEQAKTERKLAIQEEDLKRKERAHNLRQLLRAHLLMEKDIDYIISEDKVVIIDENTGRPQPGRRFADGLHQAIEAKENVSIQKETQTYATITLQNFFRMYERLAGMSGTASTEANELKQIYKLDVLAIPTHKKCQREDFHDEIYMSEREKYNAILKEVRDVHEKGRPILIGTESVDVSEKLSRIFKQNRLEHTVLNAKQHDREAEIIASAGKRGSITISTNMAGRGTDIKLEPGVAEIGGLHVVGTTRHPSRRIDRQLRGRSARQGDPGSSRFYVSFEDSLMRLFASSPRLTAILQRFRPPEGEPISASMLNKSIETAQKRIEQRNYNIRKHTLEYDDVMNKQRQEIYAFRNDILHTENMVSIAIELLENAITKATEKFFSSRGDVSGWDPEGFRQWLILHFPVSFEEGYFDHDNLEADEIERLAAEKIIQAFKDKISREDAKAIPLQEAGIRLPPHPSQEALRRLMIQKVDQFWQEHLLSMDHLRTDVNLRAVGNRDPLMEFKHEAFALFDQLSDTLRNEIAQSIFKFEIMLPAPQELQNVLNQLSLEKNRSFVTDFEPSQSTLAEEEHQNSSEEKLAPVTAQPKIGRNDQCPCGSGKKYKKCCGIYHEDDN
ncbi:Protein translocase subunit SecA [Chlamydiales bacterium STE3]|nr:Protein translocase subunit SecA [Chlamydiales bacterium STE3]